MSEKENKGVTSRSAKEYRDYIISKLEQDFDVETFPREDETKVTDELESKTSDFVEEKEGTTAPLEKAGSEEIEHSEEAKVYSKELEVPESAKVVGQTSSSLPKGIAKLATPDDAKGSE